MDVVCPQKGKQYGRCLSSKGKTVWTLFVLKREIFMTQSWDLIFSHLRFALSATAEAPPSNPWHALRILRIRFWQLVGLCCHSLLVTCSISSLIMHLLKMHMTSLLPASTKLHALMHHVAVFSRAFVVWECFTSDLVLKVDSSVLNRAKKSSYRSAPKQVLTRSHEEEGFVWSFNGEYWRRRETRSWEGCPDLYSWIIQLSI
jgi:hypothetical protein